jgi:ribosomal protein S1
MFPSLAQRNVYYSSGSRSRSERSNSSRRHKKRRSRSRSSSPITKKRRSRSRSRSLEKGQVYKATIVSIKDFGIFVKISRRKEGLVHVSQISQKRLERA